MPGIAFDRTCVHTARICAKELGDPPMKLAVIIPTYNEEGSIGAVLDRVEHIIAGLPEFEWKVFVVDSSSDQTRAIVRERAARTPHLRLIEEEGKRGIGLAYLAGIAAARSAGADGFIEFDGDGQHDAKDIARLARTLAEGYDCVVGSRYVAGGVVSDEWSFFRRILSRFGSLYVRLLLELPVQDFTSGLKATRFAGLGEVLPRDPSELLTPNYAYKIQFLDALAVANARIVEVPITFLPRMQDSSKNDWRNIFDTLRVTAILRLRRIREWRFLRVLAIGGLGFLVQAVLFELIALQLRLLTPGMTVAVVAVIAIFTNFLFHERFSFADRIDRHTPIAKRFLRFFVFTLFGSICLQWIMVHSVGLATGNNPTALRVAYVIGVGLGLLVGYAGYYFWVWSRRDAIRRG